MALGRLGVAPNPSSRLPQALRYLKLAAEDRALIQSADGRALIAEAHRTAWEFMVILVAALNANPNTTPFTSEKLKLMLKGTPLPNERNTVGRNTQFELYVPALFALANFAIEKGPPDARWLYEGDDLAIEAKRVRSFEVEKLKDNLDVAAEQILGKPQSRYIEVVKSRGLIAVNIDVYFEDLTPASDATRLLNAFNERLKVLDAAGTGLLDRYGLVGVLAFGYVAHWRTEVDAASVPRLDVLYPTKWASLAGEDPMDKSAGQRFIRAIGKIEQTTSQWRMGVPTRP